MCELLGFTSKEPCEIKRLLTAFYDRSTIHPHGWGLLSYKGAEAFIAKESHPAHSSKYLDSILTKKIKTRLLIGHIRFASKGIVSIANTHPFVQRVKGTDWSLAHNGTLFGRVDNFYSGKRTPAGGTDSERIICRIADALEGATSETEYQLIEEVIGNLSGMGKMNLLFTDGKRLFVYCNEENTLFESQHKGCYVFSSEVIFRANWKPVKTKRLFVFKDGERIYSGKRISEKSYCSKEESYEYYSKGFPEDFIV